MNRKFPSVVLTLIHKKQMKFFNKFIFNNVLGVSIAICVNGNCKADGG